MDYLAFVAVAAAALPDPGAPGEFATAVLGAVQNRNWGLLVALALIAIVWGARKFAAPRIPWLGTDRGGAAMSLAAGLGLAIGAAAGAPGQHSVLQVIGSGLLASVTASGTYVLLRKLIMPSGQELAAEVATLADAHGASVQEAAAASPSAAADQLNSVGKR